jgi:alkylation response protein AidB-like acyl-CoA dehydrogenase
MSREPSYPKDAAVGDSAAEGGDNVAETGAEGAKRTKHLVAGAAIGIGSAALVAALLYAKKRKSDR